MKPEIKSSVRHLFDSRDVNFNMLLTAARRNEIRGVRTENSKVQNKATRVVEDDKRLIMLIHQL